MGSSEGKRIEHLLGVVGGPWGGPPVFLNDRPQLTEALVPDGRHDREEMVIRHK